MWNTCSTWLNQITLTKKIDNIQCSIIKDKVHIEVDFKHQKDSIMSRLSIDDPKILIGGGEVTFLVVTTRGE